MRFIPGERLRAYLALGLMWSLTGTALYGSYVIYYRVDLPAIHVLHFFLLAILVIANADATRSILGWLKRNYQQRLVHELKSFIA